MSTRLFAAAAALLLSAGITCAADSTTATLRIPKAFGVKATAGDGIHSVKEQGNDLVIEIGSGSYRFTSEK